MRVAWDGEEATWGDLPVHAFDSIPLPPVSLSLNFSDPEETTLTGIGTLGSPYVLRETSHLSMLQSETNAHFALGKDVQLPPTWKGANLSGSLDGNGFKIIATGSMVEDGLFNVMTGKVTRLGIIGGTFFSAIGENGYKAPLCRQLGSGFSQSEVSTIEDCYARGCTVNTGGDRAGGLVGIQYNTNSKLHRVYAACTRFGADGTRVGGIRGFRDRGTSSFLYFDSDTWASTSVGSGSITNAPGGVARTTMQMHLRETYETFDFESVWRHFSNAYPEVRERRAIGLEWEEAEGWWDDYNAIHVVYEIKKNGRRLASRHPINSYYDSHVDFEQTYLYEVRARLYVVSEQLLSI